MNAHLGAIAANHLGYTAAVSGYYNIFSVNETDTISFWEEYLTSYPMLIHYKLIATGSLIEKQRVHYRPLRAYIQLPEHGTGGSLD